MTCRYRQVQAVADELRIQELEECMQPLRQRPRWQQVSLWTLKLFYRCYTWHGILASNKEDLYYNLGGLLTGLAYCHMPKLGELGYRCS